MESPRAVTGEPGRERRRGRRRPQRPGISKQADIRRWTRALRALRVFAAAAGT